CLSPMLTDGLPDFCGTCANCTRISQAEDLEARFTEAVEARENLRETDKKETRLFIQTHPDVLIIPPDPPQLMIKVDQVRRVLPTSQSRSMVVTLAALSTEEIDQYLSKHRPEWKAPQRQLVARLSEGAVGRARGFDLAAYTTARGHALILLNSALRSSDHSELF